MVLPDRGQLGASLQSAGVEVIVRPLGVIRRELATPAGAASILSNAARDGAALARLIRKRKIALVHSNTSVILGGAAAAGFARVPHIWHVRESYDRFRRPWQLYQRILRSATALPCVSRVTAQQFANKKRTHVIYDGLAQSALRTERRAARRALGIGTDAPAIAVLGRISDWKGQDVLIRALAQPPLADAIGLIAGDPWPGAEDRLERIKEIARDCAVSDRVHFLGFRDDVANVYGAADLVAVPSTEPDPLPGAAIEAAAAGCTVIASALGGLPEIVRDRETGRLVPPRDPAALAAVARELIEDRDGCERLGREAARDARTRFAPERLLEQIQSLYDSVL